MIRSRKHVLWLCGDGMDDKTKEKIEASIKDLPTLPTIAAKIFEVTNDPESSVDDLKEIISTDQVVAGRILRAVNSAYYGFPRQIDTLSKAIVILGFNNVRSLALSVSIMDVFSKRIVSGLNISELWKHAVGTAFCARSLARKYIPKDIEKIFIAGLLHDIGIVAVGQSFPGEYSKILSTIKTSGKMLYMMEDEVFGFNHADVGHFMADKWLLPGTLSTAIGDHHSPASAEVENQPISFAVHAADYLCKNYEFGQYGEAAADFSQTYRPAMDMFNITEQGCDDALKKLLDNDIEEASTFLSILD